MLQMRDYDSKADKIFVHRLKGSNSGEHHLVRDALPPRLAELIISAGHDAVHVRGVWNACSLRRGNPPTGPRGGRIVVSADSDFSALLAAQEADRPSFILFREPNLLVARDYLPMLLPVLSMLERNWRTDVSPCFERAASASVSCVFRDRPQEVLGLYRKRPGDIRLGCNASGGPGRF